MATTSETSKSRWTRFIPRQFSLRALLVLITMAALLVWWNSQLPEGTVTAANANRIKVGLRKDEVKRLLGEPVESTSSGVPLKSVWSYHVATAKVDEKELTIEFSNETVISVYRTDLMLVFAN